MPRPNLPKPEEVAGIATALRAEGFLTGSVQGGPDGSYVIAWGADGKTAKVSELDEWRARRNASKACS
jgi:hypothetical protein